MVQTNVAPGVHRIEDAYTNWYLVEEDGRLTIVDAGVPSSWDSLQVAVREIGRSVRDVAALVLTHAHFDHIGMAERVRTELNVPVYVHENDVPLTHHPLRYAYERHPFKYFVTQVKALPIVAAFVRTRAFFPTPLGEVHRFTDGTLDVPGSPRVVPTPGHTLGHVSFDLPGRDAVIAGDAVVTLNPYTGNRGPQIVARAATADSMRNLASLDALAQTGATTVLTGHGEPWTGGAVEAARLAQAAGPS
ncbi:MAG: MBL fold metallo-hydrolase [Actinomycetota bacterium]|nr:MBL fold metallo-hydrolase [Actinomycetota bacterium]